MIRNIENIELEFLTIDDYQALKSAMIETYPNMENAYWKEELIQKLINDFPQGQVVIKVNGNLAGCALSLRVDYAEFDRPHTYREVTGNYTFNTLKKDGDVLYGIEVFIKFFLNLKFSFSTLWVNVIVLIKVIFFYKVTRDYMRVSQTE